MGIISIAPMPPQQQKQGIRKPEKGLVNAMTNELSLALNGLNKITIGDTMDATLSFDGEELNPTDDDNSDQLAEQLITSAVVNSVGKTPDESPTISDEFRFDYTDEVKRKYFNVQEKNENNHSNRFHLPRKEGCHNDDEGIPSKIFANDTFVPASSQSSLSSGVVGVSTRRSNDNDKINKTQGGGNRTQTKSGGPNTPPWTLYSNKGIPPALTLSSQACPDVLNIDDDDNHDNPNTDESAGPLSPSSSMDMYSNEQKAQTSQAVTLTPILNSISYYTPEAGSLGSAASSRGSISTATHHLIKQPVLYSAIGSLEHANYNSLTNLNKRFLAPSKEFCKPGRAAATGQSILLIPPARQYQKGQQEQRTSQNSSSSQAKTSRPDLQIFRQKDRDDTFLTNKKMNASVRKENNSGNKNTGDTNSSITPSVSDDKSYTRDQINGRKTSSGNAPVSDSKTTTSANTENTKTSSDSKNKNRRKSKSNKKVSYDPSGKKKRTKSKTVEMFRPSSDAYTPRIERKKIKYKAAEARPSVQHMSSPMGTIQRPNFRDALRRVAMIIQQHIVKIESRFEQQGGQFNESAKRTRGVTNDGLFHASMRDMFNEDSYRTPTYKCNMARIPMARAGMVYGLRKIKVAYTIPSETEIYDFGHQLFKSVQLSPECSIVCLIYVERLMEAANVPLLACTWRPIFMCGLLLASKVWQDLSSWNIEFSSVYPQFSLESINKLELNFLRSVKWDLYISSR